MNKEATIWQWLNSDSPSSRLQARTGRVWYLTVTLCHNPLAVIGSLIIIGLIIIAVFAPLIAPWPPVGQDLANRLQPHGATHWMGTDEPGRDIYFRVIHGSRITLLIVALVAVISALLGLMIGAISGYFGGWPDRILMALTDVFLSMPKLILTLAFVAALGPGIENAIIAIAITAWPVYEKIQRYTGIYKQTEQCRNPRIAIQSVVSACWKTGWGDGVWVAVVNLPLVYQGELVATADLLNEQRYFTEPRVSTSENRIRLPGLAAWLLSQQPGGAILDP